MILKKEFTKTPSFKLRFAMRVLERDKREYEETGRITGIGGMGSSVNPMPWKYEEHIARMESQ